MLARVALLVLVGATHALAQSANPFAGKQMYVAPNSDARKQADEWASSR